AIRGSRFTVYLDGRGRGSVEFDAGEFPAFRHGYAGTLYSGQGRTIDQTYLFHSEFWRKASSYVGMTRHSEKTELFVAKDTVADLGELARQMARLDERRAATAFLRDAKPEERRLLSPAELSAWYADLKYRSSQLQEARLKDRAD